MNKKLRRARSKAKRESAARIAADARSKRLKVQLEGMASLEKEWEYHVKFMRSLLGKNTGVFTPKVLDIDYEVRRAVPKFDGLSRTASLLEADLNQCVTPQLMHEIRCEVNSTYDQDKNSTRHFMHFTRNDGEKNFYCISENMGRHLIDSKLSEEVVMDLIQNAKGNCEEVVSKVICGHD